MPPSRPLGLDNREKEGAARRSEACQKLKEQRRTKGHSLPLLPESLIALQEALFGPGGDFPDPGW